MSPPRLLPDRPLPPYAFVPGHAPHPVRDPSGHSFEVESPVCALPPNSDWRECQPYVWGIDLFNCGYYWEAHESWEAVWLASGRQGRLAALVQGLIKLAAAGVKLREGNARGVCRHAARACELLLECDEGSEVAGDAALWGLLPGRLATAAEQLAAEFQDQALQVDLRARLPITLLPRNGD